MAVGGSLLLFVALSSSFIQRAPVSTAGLYLAFGWAIGPAWLEWATLDPLRSASLIEVATNVAVITSLFVGGLKMRLPLSHRAWAAAYRLAGPGMVLTIVLLAAFAHLIFALPVWEALLLGAILAPTDPVLASEVSVNDARDEDRVRYGLSGEAGLNDGLAFPFVMLAIAWRTHGGAGDWLVPWALHRLLWAVPAGLAVGYLLGRGVGRLSMRLRERARDTRPSDFLALALIALSYAAAEAIGAWGFLAAFAAGVGLRRAELAVVEEAPHPHAQDASAHPPAEHMVDAHIEAHELDKPAVVAGAVVSDALSFGDALERVMELALVVGLGVAMHGHWSAEAVALGAFLFVVARPLASQVALIGSPTSMIQRWMMGWFGIRGLGTIYYLAYATVHGASTPRLIDLTLTVVVLSIVVHGISATPALRLYERRLRGRG